LSLIARLGSLCAIAAAVPATADFIYKTEITLLPGFSGVSRRVITKGETRVFYDANGYFLSMPVPNLSNPSHPTRVTKFFDGTNTYTNVFGARLDGSVVLGKEGSALTSPASMSLLGRHAQAGTIITPRATTSGAYEVEEYRQGLAPVRTQTVYTKDGRIQDIALYFADKSPANPIATYHVSSFDKEGNPDFISITYFENGKTCRIEEYTLARLSHGTAKSPLDIFISGQEVIDERLGTAPQDQVRYEWDGKVPGIDELKRMRDPVATFRSGASPTRFLSTAVVLSLVGAWLVVRNRKNRKTW
jgi:hypothetical protein